MDPQTTNHLLNMRLTQMNVAHPRMLPFVIALTVFAVLAGVKEVGGFPKPLVVTLATCFLVCLFVSSVLQRCKTQSPAGYTARLLALWAVISTVLCGAVYQLDRGGWVWFRLSGYNQAIAEERSHDVTLRPAEFVANNPAFSLETDDSTRIVLRKGDYSLSRTIVVPQDTVLTIEPGTIVRMGVGCSLISYSPIIARGTQLAPIIFAAQHHWFKWGVIGLVSTEHAVFEYVQLEDARQAVVNGTDFPGGLSLIETDAEIRNCQFTNMFGKDAIYALRGHVLVQDSCIQRTFKDGVDLDGSSGTIQGNLFVDCDDEGIDLSDNFAVDVRQNTIRDRRGGRIAADHFLAQIKRANTLEFSSSD